MFGNGWYIYIMHPRAKMKVAKEQQQRIQRLVHNVTMGSHLNVSQNLINLTIEHSTVLRISF